MPFITEKLWLSLVDKKTFLMNQAFIKINFDHSYQESKKYILKIIEIMTALRNLRADLNISYKNEIDLIIDTKNDYLKKFISNYEEEFKRLIKTNTISYEENTNQKKSAFIVLSEITILVPFNLKFLGKFFLRILIYFSLPSSNLFTLPSIFGLDN